MTNRSEKNLVKKPLRKRLNKETLDGLKATGERYYMWDTILPGYGVRVSAKADPPPRSRAAYLA